MVNNKEAEPVYTPVNYLTSLKRPGVTEEHMYDHSKGVRQDYTYVKGLESHLLRRKMILTKYPQVAQLLIADKPYTILITLALILLMMANGYWAKVLPTPRRTKTSGCCSSTPTSSADSSTTASTAASTTSSTSAATRT
jgi:hypothetical protein